MDHAYRRSRDPQADLQAIDSAHRIGQSSVEERMLERAAQKLRLEQLVIQQAVSKEELLNMITHGAETIINSSDDMLINDDIEAIIQHGEERTTELNTNALQQWEGEDFRADASGCKTLNLNMLSLSKRKRKLNYSVDSYFKDTLREILRRLPSYRRAPKQILIQNFRFFDTAFAQFQEREMAVFKRLNGIVGTVREPQGPKYTAEKLEGERAAAQELTDTAELLTEEEQVLKEQYTEAGFYNWSRRDFQHWQFVRALENYGWTDDYDLLAPEIQDKDAKAVKRYYTYFKKHWKELAEHPPIAARNK
ncbi:ISWI, HAND domain containing protein [Tylopilus felleus]